MGHGSAAAVAHIDGPALGGELLTGALIVGQPHVLAGDDEALGRLPEVDTGPTVAGAVAQPLLLLGQHEIGGLGSG
ncbi:hypothetical protein D3C71_2101540 [compost metagenome]